MNSPIPRRTALKASGLAIALPFLESMNPAIGREQEVPPKRIVTICNTLGLHPPSLFPKTAGVNYETTEYLALLNEHRSDLTLFAGLSHPDQNGKQPHDTEMTWLSAARNPGLDGFKNSISVDQYVAEHFGHVTRFPSIALSSNLQKSQSYNRNGVMLPAEHRPQMIFTKLFLEGSRSEKRRRRHSLVDGRSILDAVGEQTRLLHKRISTIDRRQLNEYFEAIRTAELELGEAEAWLDRPKPKVDADTPEDITDAADLVGRTTSLLNLIPLILQTDSTRVISVVIQDHLVVPKIKGVTSEHHNLSHHGQDPSKIKQLKIIETKILNCFAELLERMKTPVEADGRLLDNTSILFGSNLGNANAHDPSNLPIILAGGGYDHGQYIAYDKKKNTPLCNLFVNVLNKTGIQTDHFGSSTGTLSFS